MLRLTNITNVQIGFVIVFKQVIPPKFYLFKTLLSALSGCCWKRHFSINVRERHQQTCPFPNTLQQYILIIFSPHLFILTLYWLYCFDSMLIPGHQKNWRIFLVLLAHDVSQNNFLISFVTACIYEVVLMTAIFPIYFTKPINIGTYTSIFWLFSCLLLTRTSFESDATAVSCFGDPIKHL